MPRDDASSQRPRPPGGGPTTQLRSVIDRADELVATPDGQRDLAWHVAAFYIGDFSALATAALRAPAATG